MKNKIKKYLGKKAVMSYSQISLLIIATFAFSFIIWESERVKANGPLLDTGSTQKALLSNPQTATAGTTQIPVTAWKYTAEGVTQAGGTNALKFTEEGLKVLAEKYPGLAAEGGISEATLTPIFEDGNFISQYELNVVGGNEKVFSPETMKAADAAQFGATIPTGGTSTTSQFISKNILDKPLVTGGLWDAVWSGAQWAVIAYGAGYMIGSLFGMDDDNTQALSTAMAVGFGVGRFLNVYQGFPNGFGWMGKSGIVGAWTPWIIGIGIGFAIFATMYKKTEQEVVTFTCMPWQAPKGGADCEKCNDGLLPCTEYRCKSLGQLCELENKGTDQEICLAVDIRETDPPIIKPNSNELTPGFKYIYPDQQVSPPSHGFRIVPSTGVNQCVTPFTPISFGINTLYADGTPAPSRCKIDIKHTTSFDDMAYWMGGSNLYAYNHTESFSLPSKKDLENSSITLENGKTMVFYIRCEGKNDKPNVNPAEYMLRFCIDPSPDQTAPEIKATSLATGSCVSEEIDNALIDFYVNEPAECKWSYEQRSFDQMENSMVCANGIKQINEYLLYTCQANLTGIKRTSTDFYVRCKDQPTLKGTNESSRNSMNQAYKYSLRSSDGLKINKIQPTSTVYSGVSPAAVTLYVETSSGCNNGKAICYYSLTGNINDYIDFYETDTEDGIHQQTIYSQSGRQDYYIQCIDAGGNIASNVTTVNVEVLSGGPIIARAYVSQESNKLKITTLRKSECAYSFEDCDFTYNEGIEMPYGNETIHYADLRMDKNYYIKCKDEYSSEPAGCSIILKPQLLV